MVVTPLWFITLLSITLWRNDLLLMFVFFAVICLTTVPIITILFHMTNFLAGLEKMRTKAKFVLFLSWFSLLILGYVIFIF